MTTTLTIKPIASEQEYDQMVETVEQLMDKGGDALSHDEGALLETLAILIQDHDDRRHPLPSIPSGQMLSYLLETSGRATKDLVPVFGTRGRVTDVLSGKSSISKEQAQKLAEIFKVSAGLFI